MISDNTRSLVTDARSVLQQQGCTGFSSHANDLWSTSYKRKAGGRSYEPHIALNRNRLLNFEIDLTDKINADNQRLSYMKKCVRHIFLLTTAPFIMLSALTYIAADSVHPIVLKPITREIPNSSANFTYSTALVEASHIAFLADHGRSIAAYRNTFSQAVNWLQEHPHSWYWYRGDSLVHSGTQYHISNHDVYMARLDSAVRIPYGKMAQKAVNHYKESERTLWNTSYTSGILGVMGILIEALMLFYVYIGRGKINTINQERMVTTVGEENTDVYRN